MLRFLSGLFKLLDTGARRRLIVSAAAMLCLAILEALALFTLAPLLSLLTNSGTPASSVTEFIDDIIGRSENPTNPALIFGILTASFYMIKNIAAILIARWSAGFGVAEEAKMARRLARMYLLAPYSLHLRRNTAQFQHVINASLRTIFVSGIVVVIGALGDLASAFFVACVLFVLNPSLAVVTGLYLVFIAFNYRRFVGGRITHASRVLQERQPADFRHVQQTMASAKEIKVRNAEDVFADDIYRSRLASVDAYRTIALASGLPRYVLELALIGAAVVMATYAFSFQTQTEAAATVALFLTGGFRILAPINKVLTGVTAAQSALPALDSIQKDIAEFAQYENDVPVTSIPLEKLPHLQCKNVSFNYEEGADVLHDVNLDIRPGATVALVGSSGAGKSTLVDILLGLLEPNSGQVLVDGNDLQNVRRSLQSSTGYVPQSIALLDDSIRANVALGNGRDGSADERVWKSLESAQLRQVVESLPNGLDTIIGENGTRFSGGQRQRLGIARALFNSPKVLIFDEATSALDTVTEAEISAVLRSLHGEITLILIAHRLSTVSFADTIYFMDAGKVAASGSFEELNASNQAFARLVELSNLVPAK